MNDAPIKFKAYLELTNEQFRHLNKFLINGRVMLEIAAPPQHPLLKALEKVGVDLCLGMAKAVYDAEEKKG